MVASRHGATRSGAGAKGERLPHCRPPCQDIPRWSPSLCSVTTAPPGWYPNPVGDGERFWNGQEWTRNVRIPQPPPPAYIPSPPAPPAAVPPPPRQPPPPGRQYGPASHVSPRQPPKQIPRWAWYGFVGFVGVGIIGAAVSPKEPATIAVATTTTNQGPGTTEIAAPAASEVPPAETATTLGASDTGPVETLDAASMEGMTFGLLALDVNRGFGDAYERDPEGTVALVEPGAAALCDIGRESADLHEFTAKSVIVWSGLDPATQGMFGGVEGFGRGTAILMNWKCPSEAERLFS